MISSKSFRIPPKPTTSKIMREDFLDMMKSFLDIKVEETPNFKLLVILGNSPKAEYPNKSVIASRIKMNVNEDFINDKELVNAVENGYITVLNRIWHSLKAEFGSMNAEKMLFEMAGSMSITYTV